MYEASPSSRSEWFSIEDGDVLPLKLPNQILALLISQETEQDREKYYLQTQDVALHLNEKQSSTVANSIASRAELSRFKS